MCPPGNLGSNDKLVCLPMYFSRITMCPFAHVHVQNNTNPYGLGFAQAPVPSSLATPTPATLLTAS